MHVWRVSDYDDDEEDLWSMGCLSMLQQGVYVSIWLVCPCVNSHNCFFLTAVPDGVFMFHKLSGSHSQFFVQDLNCMCVQILQDFFLYYFRQVLHWQWRHDCSGRLGDVPFWGHHWVEGHHLYTKVSLCGMLHNIYDDIWSYGFQCCRSCFSSSGMVKLEVVISHEVQAWFEFKVCDCGMCKLFWWQNLTLTFFSPPESVEEWCLKVCVNITVIVRYV